ncbi:MAG: hypothetical protein ACREK5_07260, partial [Gemmatimonadota bacterium]
MIGMSYIVIRHGPGGKRPLRCLIPAGLIGVLACTSHAVLPRESDTRTEAPEAVEFVAAAPIAGPAKPLPVESRRWVEETLADLTLRQKVGQLFNVWI